MRSLFSVLQPDKSNRISNLCVLTFLISLWLLSWLFLSGCDILSGHETSRTLEKILEKGEMVVLTRNAPTTYYFGPNGETGYEYDLVTAYANHLGVVPKFEIRNTIEDVLESLANGEGDIAAAGLTLTETREQHFLFGPTYLQVQQQLVCRRGGQIPGSITEMGEVSIEVTAKSSYADRLNELETEVPNLTWRQTAFTTEEILERVWHGQVDCTVADSNVVSLNRRYMPELIVAFPLTDTEGLAWALPPGAHKLEQSIKKWFNQVDDSLSSILYGRYYGHVEIFDYVDIARFIRRIHNRLPSYKNLFREASKKYDIDWKFLAAMAYQESHWEPHAQSPTGVRGIMMLTQQTAKQVGVKNRLDTQQSIMGGARYFSNLYERIPEEVSEPDRTWIALAAYNVGMGHIYDARQLARNLNKDPNSWVQFRKVLPLLAQPKYYQKLRFGYARGSEPVRYVARIRNYYDIINNELN